MVAGQTRLTVGTDRQRERRLRDQADMMVDRFLETQETGVRLPLVPLGV